jgi:hypothetical protein
MEIFVGFSIRPRLSPCQRLNGPSEKAEMRQFGDFKLELDFWIFDFQVENLEILGPSYYGIKQAVGLASTRKER